MAARHWVAVCAQCRFELQIKLTAENIRLVFVKVFLGLLALRWIPETNGKGSRKLKLAGLIWFKV